MLTAYNAFVGYFTCAPDSFQLAYCCTWHRCQHWGLIVEWRNLVTGEKILFVIVGTRTQVLADSILKRLFFISFIKLLVPITINGSCSSCSSSIHPYLAKKALSTFSLRTESRRTFQLLRKLLCLTVSYWVEL